MRLFYLFVLFVLICSLIANVRGWSYSLQGDTLTISGSGRMDDFSDSLEAPWGSSRDNIAHVVIEDGITYVGSHAFYFFTNLLDAVIPQSVTRLGLGCFCDCHKLRSVTLHTGITQYDGAVFRTCRSLTTPINISTSVTSIGNAAFAGLKQIDSFYVDPNHPYYKTVDGILFRKSDNMLMQFPAGRRGSFVLPENISLIDYFAFEGNSLSSLTILANITEITLSLFQTSPYLETINLPDSIKSIGDQAFRDCTGLKSIRLPSSLEYVGNLVFLGCSSLSYIYYDGPKASFSCSNGFHGCNISALHICVPSDSSLTQFCEINNICKSSSCQTVEKEIDNKCFDLICENNEWVINKSSAAVEWENKTDGCVMYQCTEDGPISTTLCHGDDKICIDGECITATNTSQDWSIVINFNETGVEDVNVSEIQNTISALCGIGADDVKIALDYNDEGRVMRVILLLDDFDTAQKITVTIQQATQDDSCDIGILCENVGIKLIQLNFESSSRPIESLVDSCDHLVCEESLVLFVLISLMMLTILKELN